MTIINDTPVNKTCIKSTGMVGFGECSNLAAVDVKNGRILCIRPLHYEWMYKVEDFKPWKLKARGQVFKPPLKSMPVPFGHAYKKRIYSPNRILYPLKKIDWNPDGSLLNPNAITLAFRRIIKRAGLKSIRMHDLRHTHANLMLL